MAALAFSLSSRSLYFNSFSLFLRLISFSRAALSYAFCSSVFFGVFMPSPAAINLPAAAVDFSGLLCSSLSRSPIRPLRVLSWVSHDGKPELGEAGVGGGASGTGDFLDLVRSSMSISELLDVASSSHESASTFSGLFAGEDRFFFGVCWFMDSLSSLESISLPNARRFCVSAEDLVAEELRADIRTGRISHSFSGFTP
jgi:hypothetical protein